MSAQRSVPVGQGDICTSGDGDTDLCTILGSCIAVCLFDEKRGVGGMTHFLLPTPLTDGDRSERAGYHGPSAILSLKTALLREGAGKSDLRAKIFGGGAVVLGLGDIGRANIHCAEETLAAMGIPIIARCIGGNRARRLRFHPVSGIARVQRIPIDAPTDQKGLAHRLDRHRTPALRELRLALGAKLHRK
ncbi:MAG: chemotaxis protein CheD [Rhodobacterales bacterium]|nr:MAG: chemotaxis protein CheD [Rhodobacterales bacterium]